MNQGKKVVILCVLLGVLGYVSYKTFGPEPAPVDELASCPNGTTECPNSCLKRDAEGWTSMPVDGHPDTDVWMKFVNSDGRWTAYNQNHVGHMIELVNGKYTDTGVCPVCRGKTRVCK